MNWRKIGYGLACTCIKPTALAALFALVAVVAAAPAEAGNIRPATVLDGNETPLQTVLDDVVDTNIDVTTDQTGDALFAINGGNSTTTIVIEIAGFSAVNEFGIYKEGDSTDRVKIFSGTDSAGDSATLEITATGVVKLGGTQVATGYTPAQFGFYIKTGNGDFFFSEDAENESSAAHMLAYAGDGTRKVDLDDSGTFDSDEVWQTDDYILAWEDLASTDSSFDEDFNDMVLYVTNLTPVPEPGTLALLGLGVACLVLGVRRRDRLGRSV